MCRSRARVTGALASPPEFLVALGIVDEPYYAQYVALAVSGAVTSAVAAVDDLQQLYDDVAHAGTRPTPSGSQTSTATVLARATRTPEHLERDVQPWFEELPAVERLLCGRLIIRQLARGSERASLRTRYGPKGSVEIARMRAVQIYAFGVAIVAMALAFAGFASAAVAFFVLLAVLVVALAWRGWIAAQEGRRWRAEHPP